MDGKVVSKIHEEGGQEVNKYVLIIYVPISLANINTWNTKYILLFHELIKIGDSFGLFPEPCVSAV